MEEHQKQRVERLRDPYLGRVWVRVGCEWCGAQGRADTRAIAQANADKHNRKYQVKP